MALVYGSHNAACQLWYIQSLHPDNIEVVMGNQTQYRKFLILLNDASWGFEKLRKSSRCLTIFSDWCPVACTIKPLRL